MNDPAFLQQLGTVVINSGLAESSLRELILTICRRDIVLAKRLILPQISMSHKLELLRRLVRSEFSGEIREHWLDLANDLQDLFKYRNQIFHGMPGVRENEIIISQVKKGKNEDVWVETPITLEELYKFNERLSARHRQMMDFIEDYPIGARASLRNSPKSQNLYPRLIDGNA